MSIESTKKIIATIIVVIMMLGITTPTMAATTRGFALKSTTLPAVDIGTLTKGLGTALTGIGKLAGDAMSNLDTNKFKEELGEFKSSLPEFNFNFNTENSKNNKVGATSNQTIFNKDSLSNLLDMSFIKNTIKELGTMDSNSKQQPIVKDEDKGSITLIGEKLREDLGKIFGTGEANKGLSIEGLGTNNPKEENLFIEMFNNVKTNAIIAYDKFESFFKIDGVGAKGETSDLGGNIEDNTQAEGKRGINIIKELITNKEYRKETAQEIKEKLGLDKIFGSKEDKDLIADTNKEEIVVNNQDVVKEWADAEKAELDSAIQANGGNKLKGLMAYFRGNVAGVKTNIEEDVARVKAELSEENGTIKIRDKITEEKNKLNKSIEANNGNRLKGFLEYLKGSVKNSLGLNSKQDKIDLEKSQYYVAQKIVENGYENTRKTQEVKEGVAVCYTKDGEGRVLYLKEVDDEKMILTGQDKDGNEIEFEISNFDELEMDKGTLVLIEGVNEERPEFVLPVNSQGIDKSRADELAEYGEYPSGGKHMAVDFNTETGDPIYAVREGIVTDVGYSERGGNYVKVEHDYNGRKLISYYAHNDENIVEIGQSVEIGQQIAVSGNTGNSTGAHSHFALYDEEGNKLSEEEFKEIYTDNLEIVDVK